MPRELKTLHHQTFKHEYHLCALTGTETPVLSREDIVVLHTLFNETKLVHLCSSIQFLFFS